MSNKKMIIFITSIIFLLLGLFLIYKFIFKNNVNNKEHYVLTGEIINVESGRLLVKSDSDQASYSVLTDTKNYKVGDTISVYTKDPIKEMYPAEVIASKITKLEQANDVNENPNNGLNSNSSSSNNNTNNNKNNNSSSDKSSSSNSSDNNNSNSKPKNKTETILNNSKETKKSESDVIAYVSTLNNGLDSNENSESFIKSLKKGFVTVIDFLFYKGTIYGYTFNDLTTSAKLQVLKLAGFIDEKIENKFPGYKESISSKYQDIKGKIVISYLDWTVKVCNDNDAKVFNAANCEQAKKDFAFMKKSLNITWSLLKDLAGSAITKLNDWYVIWRYE